MLLLPESSILPSLLWWTGPLQTMSQNKPRRLIKLLLSGILDTDKRTNTPIIWLWPTVMTFQGLETQWQHLPRIHEALAQSPVLLWWMNKGREREGGRDAVCTLAWTLPSNAAPYHMLCIPYSRPLWMFNFTYIQCKNQLSQNTKINNHVEKNGRL